MNHKRKQLCLNYLKARKEFLDIANSDVLLHDNIIVRMRSFSALFFF
jgi:hypothetical protein